MNKVNSNYRLVYHIIYEVRMCQFYVYILQVIVSEEKLSVRYVGTVRMFIKQVPSVYNCKDYTMPGPTNIQYWRRGGEAVE